VIADTNATSLSTIGAAYYGCGVDEYSGADMYFVCADLIVVIIVHEAWRPYTVTRNCKNITNVVGKFVGLVIG
jgi:hypothetical protein